MVHANFFVSTLTIRLLQHSGPNLVIRSWELANGVRKAVIVGTHGEHSMSSI